MPSEFVQEWIRERQERQRAAALRQGIVEGYEDVLHGRTRLYTGDLRALLRDHGQWARGMPGET
jgi:antitoxin ParD1/3/4